MKQFQKFGLAAAVATVAVGTVAQNDPAAVSRTETGDLAIIPYYTVKDGTNTGMHIINTTDSTQVVKVRLRRGTDSKDALDFNLVMSPYDEWTANIGPSGGASGVKVTTNDTTCTVPAFPAGGAIMPETFSAGATEGYVEIIAMAETTDELQPIAVAAEHTKGVPADCLAVTQNFYRVAALTSTTSPTAIPGLIPSVRGTHTSNLTSNGACSANAVSAADAAADGSGGACTGNGAANLSNFQDSNDNALKVSFMLTDPAGGLEAGDNAVMVEGFGDAAMMTNQEVLSFGLDGTLVYDPLNFELPNLAYGAFASTDANRISAGAVAGNDLVNGSMWTELSSALDADSISNDWASFSSGDATVNADWVVTLPGQYTMTNPLCDIYGNYAAGTDSASNAACAASVTATDTAQAYSAAGGADRNQLPLLLASQKSTDGTLTTGSNMTLWDREELKLAGPDDTDTPPTGGLGFSPGGQAGSTLPVNKILLNNEVNVLAFGDPEAASAVVSDLKQTITPASGTKGWGQLAIESASGEASLWIMTGTDDVAVAASLATDSTKFTPVALADNVAVVGFALWQRSFAEQAGNYGRMVEHSTVASSGSNRTHNPS
ncbi:hypothetical protein N9M01_11995 [Luminiphilus sp.]|nr:hypothetical protein [Luminiphilus sp.]